MRKNLYISVLLAIAAACACFADSAGQPQKAAIGAPAPDFTLKDEKGNTWTLSALKGKVVLVEFGRTMCVSCQAALRDLQMFQELDGGRGVQVLHVDIDLESAAVDPEFLTKFSKQEKLTYPLLLDIGTKTYMDYGGPEVPFLAIVGRNGVIKHMFSGHEKDYAETVSAWVVQLVTEPQQKQEDPSPQALDPKTIELISVAVSVVARCKPCLTGHLQEARKLGVADAEIQAAIRIAQAIRKAADEDMDQLASEAAKPKAN